MKFDEKTLRRSAGPLFLVAAVLSVLVIVSLIFLSVSNAHMRSSSYVYAKEYIDDMSKNELYGVLSRFVNKNVTEYEEKPLVERKIKDLLSSGELSLSRAKGFKESRPKYTVYIDGREAFTLSLRKGIIFGAWRVKSFKISDNIELGNMLVIEVPSSASLTVNGVHIERSESRLSPYYKLSEFESELSDAIKSDRYTLGRFFLTPDVSVVYEGQRIQASSIDDSVLRFDYPQKMTSNYTFTVPSGANLMINGRAAGREYIVDSGVKYPFLTRFESELSGLPTANVYQISGLFSEPEIEVTYGETLLKGNNGEYALPDGMVKTYTVSAPDYAVVKVNGVTLSSGDVTAKKKELPILSGVSGYAKQRPYLTEYKVTGLLSEPNITAFDKNGRALTVSSYYSTEGDIVFNCTPSGSPSSAVIKALGNYARAYIKYVYSGNSGLQSNYDGAIQYTPYSSPAYYSLKGTYSSLYNAPQYKSISYGELEVIEYYKYSDSAYSAVVRIPFTAIHNGKTESFVLTFDFLGNFSGTRRWINYKVLETETK